MINLADFKSDTVRRWVESNPLPTLPNTTPKSVKNNNNNNVDFSTNFWNKSATKEAVATNITNMSMLLHQPPTHMILSTHETDQPLDFTMSKFKTKSSATVASQIKQFNNFAAQQHMMLLQNNGLYYNRNNNNNKSFTRGSTPSSSSSEEDGVGPPGGSPRSPPPSPLRSRTDGEFFYLNLFLLKIASFPSKHF